MSDLSLDDLDSDSLPQSGDRLQILSPEEYELLWGFPRFTQSDRDLFFTLTAPEREALGQCRSIRTKIHFLLHLGYFRARQRFFRFELPAVRDDVDYLRRRYFENTAVADLTVSDHTRKRHIEAILGLFRYRLCAFDERLLLETHARRAARISSRPVYILRELVDLLRRERVVLPGYTILQNSVRAALVFERKRLTGVLDGLIEVEDAKSLDRFLADDEGLHQLTAIKRQPRDFSYRQLLREIERGQQLRTLFALAERVFRQVELSVESVRYYASLVEYYTVYKLKRMERDAVHLYLLCFIHDRYQRLNDNLLGAFCSLVRRYVEEVAAATKEAIYQSKLQTGEDVEQGAKVLALFLDPSIDGQTPFASVREQAHALLPAQRLQQLCRHLASEGTVDEGAFERLDVDTLLLLVDQRNGFMESFEHVLGRYRKSAPSRPAIIASLMAYATNIGLGRMADICNLSYQELATAAGNYIRLETLKEANDRIANATARLPIFRHFDIDEAVHSSSDGQKFEAAIPTINARHSSKYFGLQKGVVAYTLLANHVPLNARIIGAPVRR